MPLWQWQLLVAEHEVQFLHFAEFAGADGDLIVDESSAPGDSDDDLCFVIYDVENGIGFEFEDFVFGGVFGGGGEAAVGGEFLFEAIGPFNGTAEIGDAVGFGIVGEFHFDDDEVGLFFDGFSGDGEGGEAAFGDSEPAFGDFEQDSGVIRGVCGISACGGGVAPDVIDGGFEPCGVGVLEACGELLWVRKSGGVVAGEFGNDIEAGGIIEDLLIAEGGL